MPSIKLILILILVSKSEALLRSSKNEHKSKGVPGLYENVTNLIQIQGKEDFEAQVLRANLSENELEKAEKQTIQLVQFYMATCPDCQGFSPYFKLLIKDIGFHWRKIVRLAVVNCNDDNNINVCWQQNPVLIVPLIRWYSFPKLIRDSKNQASKERKDLSELSVQHREYIADQRRDLISLRHATLRFITSIINQLDDEDENPLNGSQRDNCSNNNSRSCANETISLKQDLPFYWHLMLPISSNDAQEAAEDVREEFYKKLATRSEQCLKFSKLNDDKNVLITNFILFEKPNSYAGRTLVADWSSWMCKLQNVTNNVRQSLLMVHYTNNYKVLPDAWHKFENKTTPELFIHQRFSNGTGKNKLRHVLVEDLMTIDSTKRTKRGATGNNKSLNDKLNQRLALEQYYSKRRTNSRDMRGRRIRFRRSINNEIVNWVSEEMFPKEEKLRFIVNHIIANFTFGGENAIGGNIPGFPEHRGEIEIVKSTNSEEALRNEISDDLKPLRLTDYYKVLDEIVHKNFVSKNKMDGYQLLTSICFLHKLQDHYPFQGLTRNKQHSSTSRMYLNKMEESFKSIFYDMAHKSNNTDEDFCSDKDLTSVLEEDSLKKIMNQTVTTSETLIDLQNLIKKKHKLGLPNQAHFKWSYCAGSGPYLRGHTCSLWIMFHTLTVNEYLKSNNNLDANESNANEDGMLYEFQLKDEKNSLCDPANPEPALLNSSSSELFVKQNQFVLANIINFVRYYLSCTNCAAHFSCMVMRFPPNFDNSSTFSSDGHLLWLWEAHNKVNLRTKGTHSEDPHHPKHIFPIYKACPDCYLEEPNNSTKFYDMKFNRKELVNFIVSKYRSSAVLNNKIRIEDLYKKELPKSN